MPLTAKMYFIVLKKQAPSPPRLLDDYILYRQVKQIVPKGVWERATAVTVQGKSDGTAGPGQKGCLKQGNVILSCLKASPSNQRVCYTESTKGSRACFQKIPGVDR
jgi:hypothetical protein